MKEFEKLDKLFELEPFKSQAPLTVAKTPESSDDKTESDFDFSRNTIRDLIDKNNSVIDEMISIARSSETARPFEVVGQLVKTQSEIAKDLLQLHKQKKEIKAEDPKNIKQQNNIVFNGSTSDLMKLINNKNTIDVEPK
jgi:hypothetical protein